MDYGDLTWAEEGRDEVFRCPVFTVQRTRSRSPRGETGSFTVLDCPGWAIVIPVLETGKGASFVMVRQWRHGSLSLSLEFPGGVMERGEDAEAAAARELREETGYEPLSIRKLGEMSPNPAIMSNTVHFFLAEQLRSLGKQDLDADEFVGVELVPVGEVIRAMGRPPYIHALMASALGLYIAQGGFHA